MGTVILDCIFHSFHCLNYLLTAGDVFSCNLGLSKSVNFFYASILQASFSGKTCIVLLFMFCILAHIMSGNRILPIVVLTIY